MMLMALRPIAFLTAAALLAACGPANDSTTKAATAAAPAILATPQGKDVNSYANPLEARVTHVALDLAADFDAHVLAAQRRSTSPPRRTRRRSCSTITG